MAGRGRAASSVILARKEQVTASEAAIDQYAWSSQFKVTGRAAYGQAWRGGNDPALLGVIAPPGSVGGFFAGVQVKLPLYTGGALEAQRRQASAQARGAQAQLDATRRDIRLQVQEAWLSQRSSSAQIIALRTALASAQLQERAALTGREVGVRTQSDVLAAQAQTFEVKRQLDQALYEYEYSRAALAASAGGLTSARLDEIEQDFTPR
jgi:outer membrane protein